MIAATSAAQRAYRSALAAELRGDDPTVYWQQLQTILARGYVLAGLFGLEDGYDEARLAGAEFQVDDRPLTFARIDLDFDEFGAAEFLEAIAAFRLRVPRLSDWVKLLIRQAISLSAAIVLEESQAALVSLAAKSTAIRKVLSSSFFVSDVDLPTATKLRGILADILEGESDPDRLADVSDFIDRAEAAGAANLTDARLETVFRNNIQRAHNDGIATALSDPNTQVFIPLVRIAEVRDRRTRGNPDGLYPDQGVHWQVHGYINTMAEIRRQGIVPPNGHNCRGRLVGVTNTQAEELDLVDQQGRPDPRKLARHNGQRQALIDGGQYPDPGWVSMSA